MTIGRQVADAQLRLDSDTKSHVTSRTVGIDHEAPYSPTALNVLRTELHD